MKVTLKVYSGCENPSWHLSEKDSKSFIERFSKKTVLSATEFEAHLGYSGFGIEANTDERLPDGVPSSFHLDSKLVSGVSAFGHSNPLLSITEIGDATAWLLSKAGKSIKDDMKTYVQGEIKGRLKELVVQADKKIAEDLLFKKLAHTAACVIANTPYKPGFWNTPAVQPNNNCYNYAMNYRSNTFAQPGRKTGHMYTTFDCTSVGNAASYDGCKPTCSGSNKLVALVIWPGHDFHWYRRHSEGFWGHKPGGTAARNYDSSNRIINGTTLTPANCNRGPYTIFCGYRYSPTGMIVS